MYCIATVICGNRYSFPISHWTLFFIIAFQELTMDSERSELRLADKDRFATETVGKTCKLGDFFKKMFNTSKTPSKQYCLFLEIDIVNEADEILDVVLMKKVSSYRYYNQLSIVT